jgi:hypothetical protein
MTNTERKTWVIPKHKWHARLYRAWRSVATVKATDSYQENLCHYWRVVIFWAPVTIFCKWFFFNKTPKRPHSYDEVPPVMWLGIASIPLVFIGWAYATMTWQGATATIVGVPAFIAALIFGVEALVERSNRRQREEFHAILNGEGPEKVEKQPNLLIEVLRAKKHKVCPLIEIESGD